MELGRRHRNGGRADRSTASAPVRQSTRRVESIRLIGRGAQAVLDRPAGSQGQSESKLVLRSIPTCRAHFFFRFTEVGELPEEKAQCDAHVRLDCDPMLPRISLRLLQGRWLGRLDPGSIRLPCLLLPGILPNQRFARQQRHFSRLGPAGV